MGAIFRNIGDVITITPTAAISAGDVVAVSDNLVGVAFSDIPANTPGEINASGVYDVTITAGTAYSVGDLVTAPAVTLAGVTTTCTFGPAVVACLATDTVVRARLVKDRVIVASGGGTE